MSFSDLGLRPELLRAVADEGYLEPTPIQAAAIPAVLVGRDVLAGARTGTGKTAGFMLPLLHLLAGEPAGLRGPQVLVLTPTRELAAQVAESARTYGRYLELSCVVVFGGVNINPQIDQLRNGCDILVATPGRLLDLAGRGAVDLQQVKGFVLDEADRMLDMGFIHDIRRVLKLLPARRQNLMFSATYSKEIRELAGRFLNDPAMVEVAPRNATAQRVEQCAYKVPKQQKRHLLVHLFRSLDWQQVLVFMRTKHGANRLVRQLGQAGIAAAAIHGNKSQSARTRALADFKAGRITALVATEVAARGLDIKELPVVVNFELPNVPEDYVHRIGRTARAGTEGLAVSLLSPDEADLLRQVEKLLKQPIELRPLPEFECAEPVAAVEALRPAKAEAEGAAPGGVRRPRSRRRRGGARQPRHGGGQHSGSR